MIRYSFIPFVVIVACLSTRAGEGDEKTSLTDIAQVYEKALQDVIKQAGPSIACVLVSRSDAYKKIFRDEPPADSPGKLGAFDASKADPVAPPRSRGRRGFMREFTNSQDELEKQYNLARKDHVPESYGSGVVLDGKNLLILTNYHVVRDATKIYICLVDAEGHRRDSDAKNRYGSYADIHAADPRSDLAVLRLLDSGVGPLREIKLGDADSLQKGSFVVSLAFPFGSADPTASKGIVSNLHFAAAGAPREDPVNTNARPLYKFKSLIKTDTKLNAGCSGGALLNLKGEMIGLMTARALLSGSDAAGGFAIPMDKRMKRIIALLKEGKEVMYGFLGVSSPNAEDPLLVTVRAGSPAEKAGLRSQDRIVAVGGERVKDADDIFFTVATSLAESTVQIEIRRAEFGTRRPETISVTLAKSFVPGKITASNRPVPVRGMRVDYTSILESAQALPRPHWGGMRGVDGIQPGVVVTELQAGSKAAEHLRLNDIITHIRTPDGPLPVNTPGEFYRLAGSVPANRSLELTLLNSEPVTIP